MATDVNIGYTPAPVTTPQHIPIPEEIDITTQDHGIPSWSWVSWYNRIDGYIQQLLAFMALGGQITVVNAVGTANPALTTTPTAIAGTTITLNKAGTWIIRGYSNIRADPASNLCIIGLKLSVGGIQAGDMECAAPTGLIAVFQLAYEWLVTVTGTTTTAQLVGSKSVNAGVSLCNSVGTAIFAEWIHA